KDQDVERVYKQYILEHITLSVGEKSETMVSKYPMPKATEAMSYGTMPKIGKDQIALTPSLAKKFDREINQLVGKELIINQGKTNDTLTISGIYNAGYDDFFVSNDIEQKFYEPLKDKKPYAVSYDVKTFEAVVSVAQMLEQAGINAKTAAEEVSALQKTFENLNRLFLITALLILGIGLLISTILLVKLQNSRIREIGLLSALGFSKNKIRRIIMNENLFLSIMAILFNALLMGMVYGLSIMFKWSLIFTIPQILVSLFGTGFVIILIGISAGHRLVQTEPASALRN
ncbi:MAG: ABC transporter permease, partial [Eubacterium sp.]